MKKLPALALAIFFAPGTTAATLAQGGGGSGGGSGGAGGSGAGRAGSGASGASGTGGAASGEAAPSPVQRAQVDQAAEAALPRRVCDAEGPRPHRAQPGPLPKDRRGLIILQE